MKEMVEFDSKEGWVSMIVKVCLEVMMNNEERLMNNYSSLVFEFNFNEILLFSPKWTIFSLVESL